MNDLSTKSDHALTMYRWTALTAGLTCLCLAPLLRNYVPDIVDPWLPRTLVGASYLVSVTLSFFSIWVKEHFRQIMVCLTYAISAWLILLNHLNQFHPALAYAIFEVLVGGSIAFIGLRSLSIYLATVCVAVALLVFQSPNSDLHTQMYLSTLVVVAILVLIVNYWRSHLLKEAQVTGLLMQSVFNNSADALILLNNGQLVSASDKSLSMLNATDFEDIAQRIAPYITNRETYRNCSTDVHITDEAGLNLWVEIVVTQAGGKALELMRLTDISARKQAELELTQAVTTAETALRARRDFLTTISHELRTPLNGVIGASRLLAAEHTEGSDADLIRNIERSGQTLLASIDNIIAYAELDSGDLDLREETLSVEHCINYALGTVREQAQKKQLQIEVQCTGSASASRTGDPIRLTQIFELLLNNAVKFTNQGSVTVTVVADEELNPDRLTFQITDTGVGIEPNLREHIFDSFTQGDASDARAYGGIGLGLAICARLVNRLGGRLACQSELDQGSTFHFSLPLPLASEVIAIPEPHRIPSSDATNPTTNPTTSPTTPYLLLVEDNEMNQKITLRMLDKLGYQADLAIDGREAIIACQAKHYDLILMDLQMPNMGGLEATVALRAQTATQETPIIALTANAQASDRERCLIAGMNDFLAKPARLDRLQERLQHHLARSG